MRRLLAVAYHYPPISNVRSIGNAKLIKYLSRMNWDIHVLAGKVEIFEEREKDNSLLNSVPKDVQITRIDGYSRYVRGLESKSSFPGLWWWLPDREVLWMQNSIQAGSRIIKRKGIDLIYSFSPPYSATLIGLCLSRLHNIPLIIDFRDPWTQNCYLPRYPTRFHNWLNQFLEHLVATNSTCIVFNSPSLKRIFLDKYKDISEEKCYVVTNGYDLEDFEDISRKKLDKFTISGIGYLNSGEPFFKNISHLLEIGKIEESDICLQMTLQDSETVKLVSKYSLDEITRLLTQEHRIPYKESLDHMVNSHLLLLTLPKHIPYVECVPTSKIYHYMATGNPILGVVPPGEAMKLIQNYKNGIAIDPSDDKGIQNAILDFYSKFKNGELRPIAKSDIPQEYRFDKLAIKLNRIFERFALVREK